MASFLKCGFRIGLMFQPTFSVLTRTAVTRIATRPQLVLHRTLMCSSHAHTGISGGIVRRSMQGHLVLQSLTKRAANRSVLVRFGSGGRARAARETTQKPSPSPTATSLSPSSAAHATAGKKVAKAVKAVKAAKEQTLWQRARTMMTKYGPIAFIWGTVVSICTFTGCYFVIEEGLLGPNIVKDAVLFFGLDLFFDPDSVDPTLGTLALAIVLNEIINPVRWAFTLATLPWISRWFYGLRLVKNSRWTQKI